MYCIIDSDVARRPRNVQPRAGGCLVSTFSVIAGSWLSCLGGRRGGGDTALPSAMSARRQASTTSLSKYARDGSPDPSARYLDFCNAFWGPNDTGVDVLFARMRGAARTMEELRSFWKERYRALAFLVIVSFLYSVGPSSRRTTRNGSLNSPKRHWEGTR